MATATELTVPSSQQASSSLPREQRVIGSSRTAEAAAAVANARKAQNSEYGLLSLTGNFQRFFDPILFDQQVNILGKFMEKNNISFVTPELAQAAIIAKTKDRNAALSNAMHTAKQASRTHEGTLRELADKGILSEGKIFNLNTPENKPFQDAIIESIVTSRSKSGLWNDLRGSLGVNLDNRQIRSHLQDLARQPQFANTEVARFIQGASKAQLRRIARDLQNTAKEVRQTSGDHLARLQNIDLAITNMVAGDKKLEKYFNSNRIYILARYGRLGAAAGTVAIAALTGIAISNPITLLPAAGALAITAGISYWSKHRTNVMERELYQRGLVNPKGQNFEPPKWSQMNTGQRAAKVVGAAVKPLFGGVEVSKERYNYNRVSGKELLEGIENQHGRVEDLAAKIQSASTEAERTEAVNAAIARMAEIDTRIDFSVDQNVNTIDYGRFGRRDFLLNWLQRRAGLQDAILSGLQAEGNGSADYARATLKYRLDQQRIDITNTITDDQVIKNAEFRKADIATSARAAIMSAALSFGGGKLVRGVFEQAAGSSVGSVPHAAPDLANVRPMTAGVSDFTGKPFEDAGKDLLHVVQDVGRSTQKGFADIQHDWNTQNAGKFYQDVATQPLRPLQGLGGLNQVGEDVVNGVAVNAGEAIQGGIDNAKNLGSTIGTDWDQFWSNVGKDIGGLQTVVEHPGSHGGGIDYGQHAEDIPVLKGDVSLPSGDHFVFDPTHHSIDIVDAKNQILATDVHIDSASHHLIGLDLEGHKILDLPAAKSVMEFAQSTKINYLPDTLPHHDWQQLHTFVRHDGGSNYIHVDYTAHDGPKGFTSLETPNGEHIFIKGSFNLASSGPHAGDIVHLVKFDPTTHKVVDIGTMQSSELAHQLGLTQTRIDNYTEIINKAHGGLWHGTQDAADLQVIMAQRGILSNGNHGQALFGMRMGGGYFNKDGVFQIGASNHTFDHSLIKGPTGHSYVISEGQLKPLGPFGSEPVVASGEGFGERLHDALNWIGEHKGEAAFVAGSYVWGLAAARGTSRTGGSWRDRFPSRLINFTASEAADAAVAQFLFSNPFLAASYAAGFLTPIVWRNTIGRIGRGVQNPPPPAGQNPPAGQPGAQNPPPPPGVQPPPPAGGQQPPPAGGNPGGNAAPAGAGTNQAGGQQPPPPAGQANNANAIGGAVPPPPGQPGAQNPPPPAGQQPPAAAGGQQQNQQQQQPAGGNPGAVPGGNPGGNAAPAGAGTNQAGGQQPPAAGQANNANAAGNASTNAAAGAQGGQISLGFGPYDSAGRDQTAENILTTMSIADAVGSTQPNPSRPDLQRQIRLLMRQYYHPDILRQNGQFTPDNERISKILNQFLTLLNDQQMYNEWVAEVGLHGPAQALRNMRAKYNGRNGSPPFPI